MSRSACVERRGLGLLFSRLALQASGLSWPSLILDPRSEKKGTHIPEKELLEKSPEEQLEPLTFRDPAVDLTDGTIEGERYDYRLWARWACR